MPNTIVFVKQVPSTETKIKIDQNTSLVDLKEVEWVINPYDEYAIEEALRLKEKFGGSNKVISIGPERVKTALKTALAMGIDEAIHIFNESDALDFRQLARLAADVIKEYPFDLILCGKQGIDYDQSAFPLALAEFLKIPFATVVIKTELNEKEKMILVHREVDNGCEIVELPLPALITCQKGLNEPRYPTLRLMMAAQKKTILTFQKEGASLSKVKILKTFLPPPRKSGKILDGPPEMTTKELVRLLREEARII